MDPTIQFPTWSSLASSSCSFLLHFPSQPFPIHSPPKHHLTSYYIVLHPLPLTSLCPASLCVPSSPSRFLSLSCLLSIASCRALRHCPIASFTAIINKLPALSLIWNQFTFSSRHFSASCLPWIRTFCMWYSWFWAGNSSSEPRFSLQSIDPLRILQVLYYRIRDHVFSISLTWLFDCLLTSINLFINDQSTSLGDSRISTLERVRSFSQKSL